jgi:23S rRNA (cytosine1962-C5)-methyltransferase
MTSLILKPGREKSLLRRHPWIFSGAVARVDGRPAAGETVDLLSSTGAFLARAAYSPDSQIRARVWTFDPSEPVDVNFFRRRIASSIQARAAYGLTSFCAAAPDRTPPVVSAPPAAAILPADLEPLGADVPPAAAVDSACRLIYAESDGLPGLIVDRYAEVLVAQFLSTGADYWRELIIDTLGEVAGPAAVYERSDADVRELEGLAPRAGLLRGHLTGPTLTIREDGLLFKINIETGHKTGFYLDQRRNRRHVRRLAEGRDVLDCFCYTGGFSVNALAGGAKSVLSVDSSAEALALCIENAAANQLPADRHRTLEGDVFQVLRRLRDEGRSFDMVILDPPKFAPTAAWAEKAARGYKDINLLGFKLLRPGGLLVTFSCSGGVEAALFQKIVAAAALDAGADASITAQLSQAPDHPVALNFPEAAYLKGLVCLKR